MSEEVKPKRNRKVKKFELTDVQKEVINELWDKEPLNVVAQRAFMNSSLDLNSPETQAVREYIASLGESEPKEREKVTELTEAQKNNIRALLDTEEPPTVREITLMLFPDIKDLGSLHKEYRLVYDFVKLENENATDAWDEPVETRRYQPPLKMVSLIGMANRYVGNPHDPGKSLYDMATLKKAQDANLRALLSYMKTSHFVTRASLYQRKADRDLFESTFVRHVHDKAAELTAEEVDTYITIAVEVVRVSQFDRDIALQERIRNNVLEGAGDADAKIKLSMSLVESINSMMDKRDASNKQIQSLIKSVAGERAKRLSGKGVSNDAIVNLINLWIEEQSRLDLIALAKKEHEEDEKEFGRIRDLDEAIALMAGLTHAEAVSGP
jgi:hypothetical protein